MPGALPATGSLDSSWRLSPSEGPQGSRCPAPSSSSLSTPGPRRRSPLSSFVAETSRPKRPGGLGPPTLGPSRAVPGDVEQARHADVQGAREGIVPGPLAAQPPPVDRLAEDGGLPVGERLVPGQAAHRAPNALLVARGQLGATREAREAVTGERSSGSRSGGPRCGR